MNLYFLSHVQERNIDDVIAYTIKKSDSHYPIIIVGFQGGKHNARTMENLEMSIREYLNEYLTKKMVSREIKTQKSSSSGQGALRGNEELDRTYHKKKQFHFYEGNGSGKVEKIIRKLKTKYSLNLIQELPRYLASDLEKIV